MSLFGNLYTDPFSDLLDMQRRMDRLMNRFVGPTETTVPLLTGAGGGGFRELPLVGTGAGQIAQWNPRMDVRDTDKGLIVHAELPGCTKDNIKLSFDHNTNCLVLQGEKKAKKKDRGENWVRKERFEGSFYRTLPLPPGCDINNIQANFTNGVLKVTVPKPSEAGKRKMIDIKTSEKAGGIKGEQPGLQQQGLQGQQPGTFQGEKTVPISSEKTTGVEEPRPNIQTQSTVF